MSLESLAPDQRAVVLLVLQQGRSYDQLAGMLGISAEAVRGRARSGLAALAEGPGLPEPVRADLGEYLLGQQEDEAQRASQALLAGSPEARAFAHAAAAELGQVTDAELPLIPEAAAPATAPAAAASAAVPAAAAAAPATTPTAAPEASAAPAAPPARRRKPSSKLGGALVLAVVGLAAAVAVVLFASGGDDDEPAAARSSATTQTSTAEQPQVLGQIALRAVGGSQAQGLVELLAQGGNIGFALVAQKVPASRTGEAYAVWLVNPGGRSRRLGFAQPVGEDGLLQLSGPQQRDLAGFSRLLTRYRQIVVTRERDEATSKPGPVILRGSLRNISTGSR